MDDKQRTMMNRSSLRRTNLIHDINVDESDSSGSSSQRRRLIPISLDHLSQPITSVFPAAIVRKRRRCSTTTLTDEQSLIPPLPPLSLTDQDTLFDRNLNLAATRKRQAQDDMATYATHHLFLDSDQYQQCTHKRARYEQQSASIELENQPPRPTIKRRSLLLYHHQQQQQHQFSSSIWDHAMMQNEAASFFDQFPPSSPLFRTTTTPPAYHRTNSAPNNHEQQQQHENELTNNYDSHQHTSILIDEEQQQSIRDHDYHCIFGTNRISSNHKSVTPKPPMGTVNSNNMRLLPSQSTGNSPLRTTHFVSDGKQQTMTPTIMRTGNISPAHSDSSTESSSTCSSDEQMHQNFASLHAYAHHHHHHHHHHQQPWRSFRERENYEQLLDLAEKLSDPNRFNQFDIQQFVSYRYKTISTPPSVSTTASSNPLPISTSRQTACVICMSQFKNRQHIRILPCLHEYHSKCIARWFTMNSSCPICRRDSFQS